MKQRYQITGTTRLGDYVRIFLDRQDIVEEKLNLFEAFGNLEHVQQKQQEKAVLMQQPDVVTIPFETWKKKMYKIGDFLWLEIQEEE